jgi:CheY-like chemotaxis protein/GGDEF domain-containing protein
MQDAADGSDPKPVLTRLGFARRMAEEVARVGRKGGFLSLLLIDVKPAADAQAALAHLNEVAERLRARVRLNDVLAIRATDIALLMPDTNGAEAACAARRLLRLDSGEQQRRESGGLATVFGEVEGGGEALAAAAEDALRKAQPGVVVPNESLAGRPQVLVVDDDLAFAQMLCEMISERSWDAHPCSSVEDARQRVLEGTYSGLFIDLMLPGSSGVEILRRGIAAHPRRPAVLMSGSDAEQRAILEAIELGPVTFIRKPISSGDLDLALQMFRELLPGGSGRPRLRVTGPRGAA